MSPVIATWAPLVVVVALAFATEAALGFGATVLTVALGQLLLPIDRLLPAFVPVNIVLSLMLVARGFRHVDRRLLVRRILPWMALGMPVGMFGFRVVDAAIARRVFGASVIVLAAAEIWQLVRGRERQPPRPAVGHALLAVAGVLHGAFATGGPLVVYVLGKSAGDKATVRATLAVLWFVLNTAVAIGFVVDGRIGAASGVGSLLFVAGLAVGVVLGEVVFRRFSEVMFRRAVFGMLFVAGALLVFR